MRQGLTLIAVFAVALVYPTVVFGLDYDFSGTFTKDNDVLLFSFSVGSTSTVTVFSSSWLEGNPPHGFDPMLGIWTASGNLIYFQDDGHVVGSTYSNSVLYNHGTWDSYYAVSLDPGSYFASVTQYSNFNNSSTLGAGFWYDGTAESQKHFTYYNGYGGATQLDFNGVWDSYDPRASNWEFHILNVEEAVVVPGIPEPSTLIIWSILGSLAIAVGRRCRRKSA